MDPNCVVIVDGIEISNEPDIYGLSTLLDQCNYSKSLQSYPFVDDIDYSGTPTIGLSIQSSWTQFDWDYGPWVAGASSTPGNQKGPRDLVRPGTPLDAGFSMSPESTDRLITTSDDDSLAVVDSPLVTEPDKMQIKTEDKSSLAFVNSPDIDSKAELVPLEHTSPSASDYPGPSSTDIHPINPSGYNLRSRSSPGIMLKKLLRESTLSDETLIISVGHRRKRKRMLRPLSSSESQVPSSPTRTTPPYAKRSSSYFDDDYSISDSDSDSYIDSAIARPQKRHRTPESNEEYESKKASKRNMNLEERLLSQGFKKRGQLLQCRCGKLFKKSYDASRHLSSTKKHIEERFRRGEDMALFVKYRCKKCWEIFPRKDTFVRHQPNCGQRFKRKNQYSFY